MGGIPISDRDLERLIRRQECGNSVPVKDFLQVIRRLEMRGEIDEANRNVVAPELLIGDQTGASEGHSEMAATSAQDSNFQNNNLEGYFYGGKKMIQGPRSEAAKRLVTPYATELTKDETLLHTSCSNFPYSPRNLGEQAPDANLLKWKAGQRQFHQEKYQGRGVDKADIIGWRNQSDAPDKVRPPFKLVGEVANLHNSTANVISWEGASDKVEYIRAPDGSPRAQRPQKRQNDTLRSTRTPFGTDADMGVSVLDSGTQEFRAATNPVVRRAY